MMRPRAPRTGACLLLVVACAAGPALAQQKKPLALDVDVGLGFVSANIDRGIVLSNLPQLAPHLKVVVKSSPTSRVIIGFRGLAELTTPRDSTKFGLAADSLKRPNLIEAQPSLTFVQGFGPKGDVAMDVGFTYRMFPNVAGTTSTNNTGQFRVGLGGPNLPVPVRVGALYETGPLEGPTVEASVGGDFPFGNGSAAVLKAEAGYAVDVKAVPGLSPRLVPLARTGFTHVDLTAGLDLTVAGAGIRPLVTVTYVRDTAATPVLTPSGDRKYIWLAKFGVSMGIRKSVPKAAPPPPPPPPAKGAKPAAAPAKPGAAPAKPAAPAKKP